MFVIWIFLSPTVGHLSCWSRNLQASTMKMSGSILISPSYTLSSKSSVSLPIALSPLPTTLSSSPLNQLKKIEPLSISKEYCKKNTIV